MKFKLIGLAAIMTFTVWVTFLMLCRSAEWPERGFSDIKSMLKVDDFSFDCYPSTWAEGNSKRLGKISNLRSLGTNEQCKYEVESVIWRVFPQAVNATLRCEIDGITGESTVTVFKDKNTSYGEYFCHAAHFPNTEWHEVGSVTEVMETPY